MNEFVARNSVDSIRNEYAGLGHSDDLDRTFGSCSNRRLSTMQAITDGIPLANYVPIAEWERLEARNKELEEFALESAQTIKSLFDALQKSKDNEKKALEQYEKVLQLSVGLNKDNPKELQEKAASIENIAMQRLIESEKTVKSALEKLDELEGYVFSLECEVEDKMKLLEENGMTSQEELRKKENFFKSTEESLCKNLASERALREEMSNVLSESLVLISDLIQNPQVAAKAPKSTA